MYKNRIQMYNPRTKKWVKLDTKTGRIIGHKSDKKPYKNVKIRPDDRKRVEKLLSGMGWSLEDVAKHMKM